MQISATYFPNYPDSRQLYVKGRGADGECFDEIYSDFTLETWVDQANGDDSNTGEEESPVATIEKAQEIATKIVANEKVIHLVGDYLNDGVDFSIASDVTYEGGRLLSGEFISGGTYDEDNNIYSFNPGTKDFGLVNSKGLINEHCSDPFGLTRIESVNGSPVPYVQSSEFPFLKEGDIILNINKWAEEWNVIQDLLFDFAGETGVVATNYGRPTVALGLTGPTDLDVRSPEFGDFQERTQFIWIPRGPRASNEVQDVLDLLDDGEFYCNPDDGTVYIKTENPEDIRIIENRNYYSFDEVFNVKVNGTEFNGGGYDSIQENESTNSNAESDMGRGSGYVRSQRLKGVVQVKNSENVIFSRCRFLSGKMYGVLVQGEGTFTKPSVKIGFDECSFFQCSGGIKFGAWGFARGNANSYNKVSRNCFVTNSNFYELAKPYITGSPATLYACEGLVFSNNVCRDYLGVGINAFLLNKCLIEYNDIKNDNALIADAGCFHSGNAGSEPLTLSDFQNKPDHIFESENFTIVRFNNFFTRSRQGVSATLYNDSVSEGYIYERNLVGCDGGRAFWGKSQFWAIRNIFYSTGTQVLANEWGIPPRVLRIHQPVDLQGILSDTTSTAMHGFDKPKDNFSKFRGNLIWDDFDHPIHAASESLTLSRNDWITATGNPASAFGFTTLTDPPYFECDENVYYHGDRYVSLPTPQFPSGLETIFGGRTGDINTSSTTGQQGDPDLTNSVSFSDWQSAGYDQNGVIVQNNYSLADFLNEAKQAIAFPSQPSYYNPPC